MTFIRSVLGDVPPSALGVTNSHEHVLIASGLILKLEPDFRLDSIEKGIEELCDFHSKGGRALVEASPIGAGRDPDGLRSISAATGVTIISATGFHKTKYYLDSHWRFRYSADEIARLFIEEIEIGIEKSGYEGPFIRRSEARAGIIKVASDYQVMDLATRTAFQAAAIAHAQTGAPVLTHTEMGTMAIAQLETLAALGIDSKHVVLSHMDRNPDLHLHKEVAQTGAFLEYDSPGRVKYFPESTLIGLIRGMVEAGLGGQILLGGDTARRSYWKAYGGGPGVAYILEHFTDRMRCDGFSQQQIDDILIHNPARAFVFAKVGT